MRSTVRPRRHSQIVAATPADAASASENRGPSSVARAVAQPLGAATTVDRAPGGEGV